LICKTNINVGRHFYGISTKKQGKNFPLLEGAIVSNTPPFWVLS